MSDSMSNDAQNRLIVALDVPTVEEAGNIVKSLEGTACFYKIGYQLAFAGGIEFARELKQSGYQIFLDMKLLDIDNTIAKAVENIAKLDFDMLTLHAYPKAMRSAVRASEGSSLCLLGVTVLTSMDDEDLKQAGYHAKANQLVLQRANDAAKCDMGGVVASAMEAGVIKSSFDEMAISNPMAIVTPGIRPAGSNIGDQKRVMTPMTAIQSGATHLVVGRPIVGVDDRKQAAQSILDEINSAIDGV